ncbi:MAG: histidine--tRNA ligase [Anaerolineales bacterium]|nr:histidine--tRNA ligase [Anaerolineales bacterium]
MKTIIPSLKGTRDFYPEEMAARTWLYQKLRRVSERFGYQEYEGPMLELVELYAAKSGEELVNEQSFVFPDRGGELIALRPELTLTLSRMVAQRQRQLVYPLRWWSFGPFWRYERPQKGRSREFFQWNVDLIGVDTPAADAELIAIIATFFNEVGLSPCLVGIGINDRQLITTELEALSIPDGLRPAVFRLIDRREKLPPPDWAAYARDLGLNDTQFTRLQELLADGELWKKSNSLRSLFAALEAYGVSNYARYDPSIIRGLDYYTSTVFEAKELTGDIRRSILGGGRYDNLLEAVGGEPLPGTGFAMGDVVITLILKQYGCLPPDLGKTTAQVLVTTFDEASSAASITLAMELRQAGLDVLGYPRATPLSKQIKFADRVGVNYILILGPDEIKNGVVTLKDLRSGEQRSLPRSEAVAELRKLLAHHKPS